MATATAVPSSVLPPPNLSISPLNGKMVLGVAAMAKTLVTVSNLSSNPGGVVFKVKTTKPRRYLVRPNQGILGPGERKEVVILMSSEKQAEARKEQEEHAGVMSDKFQVVYLSSNEAAYDGLKNAVEGQEQVEKLERLWEQADKRAVCSKKFDVELVLPEGSAAQASRNAPSTASSEKSGKPAPPPSSVGELQKPEFVSPSSFASNEMADYRQRYDELVTFTVALTGERDLLINALDSVKLQLRRELASHGDRGQPGSGGGMKHDPLSLHKRRSSKASSFSSVSTIPGIASHARGSTSALDARHGKHGPSSTNNSSSSKTKEKYVSIRMLLLLVVVAVWLGHQAKQKFGVWWWYSWSG